MLKINSNFSNHITNFFKEKISFSLSIQNQKILAIMIVALGCLAICYKFTSYCFKPKKTILSDGTIVEGKLVNGKLQGKGKITYPNGYVKEGFFKDGLLNGQGSLIEDKFIKTGEFKNDVLHGKGKQVEDTSVYEGMFKEGSFTGPNGTYTSLYQIEKGEFKDFYLCGEGMITYLKSHSQKKLEKGTFEKSELHGKGIRIYQNGNQEEGMFKKGIFQGIAVV